MKEPRDAWVVVWAAFVSVAVIFGIAYSFAAFFAPFEQEFGVQRADVSLVFGLCGLIYFLLGAPAGMLADRLGPRKVCVTGMVFIAGGLLATSFATSIAAVYAAYGIGIGVGVGLVYAPAMASVSPWFTRRRGLAAGIASAGIGAGTVVVPLLATSTIDAFDWRAALRVLAAGVLVVGVAGASLLRRAPLPPAAAVPPGATLREALRSAPFWWFYLAAVVSGPVMFIPFAHVSAAARDLGVADASAVGLVGLIGAGSVFGRFAIGSLADRMGRIPAIVAMQASMGLSFLLWGSAGGYAALAVFALWFGLSYGAVVSLMPAICMDMFGARAVSGILGTLYTGAAFGNLLGPYAAGWVFDRHGSYQPVIWACVALAAVATAACARLLSRRAPAY